MCELTCSVVHVKLEYQVRPGVHSFDLGFSQSGKNWRLSLNTGEFVNLLRRLAVEGEQAIQHCVSRRSILLPAAMGLNSTLLVAGQQTSANRRASAKSELKGGVVGWMLHMVEFTMMPDYLLVGKPYQLNPPGTDQLPDRIAQWWRTALPDLTKVVGCVQMAQFTQRNLHGGNAVAKWEDLPIVVWAKPVTTDDATSTSKRRRFV